MISTSVFTIVKKPWHCFKGIVNGWAHDRHEKEQARIKAFALYDHLVTLARIPKTLAMLQQHGTLGARLDMLTFHMMLALYRLNQQGSASKPVAQALVDVWCVDLDQSFREAGIGDLSVGRYVKRTVQQMYGLLHAWVKAKDDKAIQEAILHKNIAPDASTRHLRALAAYADQFYLSL